MNRIKNRLILLVEDESLIAVPRKAELEKAGYDVMLTSTGEEAIKIICIKEEPVDLILMDIDLGRGIDGTETAKKILEEHNIPVIFLSSYADPDIFHKTEKITSYGYVDKSSGMTVLDASIKAAFRLSDIIKKQKHTECALRENEKFLLSIIDNIPHMIFIKDAVNLRFIRLNKAAESLLGYNSGDLTGKSDHDFFPAEQADFFIKKDRDVLDSGSIYDIPEEPIDTKTGKRILHTKKIPLYHKDGSPAYLLGISEDITERKTTEDRVHSLLREKEIILKEVHHRIRNNMNTVAALLSLQANMQKNSVIKNILMDSSMRIHNMNILYDRLYCSENFSSIPLGEYLKTLIDEIKCIYGRHDQVKISILADEIDLECRMASSIGIIINELITNSMKYAFKGREGGVINVRLLKNNSLITLAYEDDGTGLPESVNADNSSGFGLQLINMLVEQIRGSLEIERKKGTRFTISFSV